MANVNPLSNLHKVLEVCAKKSIRKLQASTMILDRNNDSILALENNSLEDSGVAALSHISWFKKWFSNYVMISTHVPTPRAISLARVKNIKHIYFFENLSGDSITLLKKYKIPYTRLIVTKV